MINGRLEIMSKINQTDQLSRGNTERERLRRVCKSSTNVSTLDPRLVQRRGRIDELRQLSHAEDDLFFLQSFPAFSTLPAAKVCIDRAVYVSSMSVRGDSKGEEDM